jgi:L-asparagine transporter-like permease
MVAALDRHGISWAGTVLNLVLITAILSTMLASVFGLGRIFRSLADEGLAPRWLRDKKDVPYRGILVSGAAMLIGLGLGLLFPSVYLFLVSSGGFAMLFTYAVIMATHIRFRRKSGCPPDGKCQMWGYPYTSLIVLIALILSILSMPFVAGQASGLVAGVIMVVFFAGVYAVMRALGKARGHAAESDTERHQKMVRAKTSFSTEAAKETDDNNQKKQQ